jgi:hypothetical protein
MTAAGQDGPAAGSAPGSADGESAAGTLLRPDADGEIPGPDVVDLADVDLAGPAPDYPPDATDAPAARESPDADTPGAVPAGPAPSGSRQPPGQEKDSLQGVLLPAEGSLRPPRSSEKVRPARSRGRRRGAGGQPGATRTGGSRPPASRNAAGLAGQAGAGAVTGIAGIADLSPGKTNRDAAPQPIPPRPDTMRGTADLRTGPEPDPGQPSEAPGGAGPDTGARSRDAGAAEPDIADRGDPGARRPRRVIVLGQVISEGSETAAPAAPPAAASEEVAASDVVRSGLVLARQPAATAEVVLAGTDELAEPLFQMPAFVLDASRAGLAWAHRRAFGLSSACGIWIALAVCSATWFSAGTRAGNFRAVAALWAGYLVLLAGQVVARSRDPRAERQAAGPVVSLEEAPSGFRRATTADRRAAGPAGWLASLGSSLAESVVYAGLALGALAERWPDAWALAIAVLGLCAVRNLMTACSTPPGFSDRPDGWPGRMAVAVVTMPVGGRMLLVGIVAPVWGARAALLALLDWAIISVGYGIAGRVREALTEPRGGDAEARPGLVRLRDDGVLARALGALVRGSLLPLPPAVLGLTAMAVLTFIGLHSLAGVLTVGPAVVMLLAAPGSGHPHNGRFDWVVPVILLGAQVLYLAATGLAVKVPGPVIFALLAALLLRYCDLAFPARPVMLTRPRHPGGRAAERGTGLGWEGRMLLAGLGAGIGIATVAYLALTAYLGVLIGAKVVTRCLAPERNLVHDRPGNGGRREPPSAS